MRVKCRWHGSLFSLKTGDNPGPPGAEGVPRYSVRVEGDDFLGAPQIQFVGGRVKSACR